MERQYYMQVSEVQVMGGRGSGINLDKKPRYEKDHTVLAQFGNVKVVKHKNGSSTSPLESIHKGIVYATVDSRNNIKSFTFYDPDGDRIKQIDVRGKAHNGALPHTHHGFEHDEYGTYPGVSEKDQKLIDDILALWERKRKRLKL